VSVLEKQVGKIKIQGWEPGTVVHTFNFSYWRSGDFEEPEKQPKQTRAVNGSSDRVHAQQAQSAEFKAQYFQRKFKGGKEEMRGHEEEGKELCNTMREMKDGGRAERNRQRCGETWGKQVLDF
jgi:hypothetical protein